MNVSPTPELDRFVAEKVESGRYTSEHEQSRAAQLASFNRELAVRLAALDRGEYVTAEESLRRIEERSAQRRKRIA